MKATNKTVLYVGYKDGAKQQNAPIGIYANEDKCRPPAVAIVTAHRAGDAKALRTMGLGFLVNEDDTLKPLGKFQRLTLPYEPEFGVADADPFADDSSPAK